MNQRGILLFYAFTLSLLSSLFIYSSEVNQKIIKNQEKLQDELHQLKDKIKVSDHLYYIQNNKDYAHNVEDLTGLALYEKQLLKPREIQAIQTKILAIYWLLFGIDIEMEHIDLANANNSLYIKTTHYLRNISPSNISDPTQTLSPLQVLQHDLCTTYMHIVLCKSGVTQYKGIKNTTKNIPPLINLYYKFTSLHEKICQSWQEEDNPYEKNLEILAIYYDFYFQCANQDNKSISNPKWEENQKRLYFYCQKTEELLFGRELTADSNKMDLLKIVEQSAIDTIKIEEFDKKERAAYKLLAGLQVAQMSLYGIPFHTTQAVNQGNSQQEWKSLVNRNNPFLNGAIAKEELLEDHLFRLAEAYITIGTSLSYRKGKGDKKLALAALSKGLSFIENNQEYADMSVTDLLYYYCLQSKLLRFSKKSSKELLQVLVEPVNRVSSEVNNLTEDDKVQLTQVIPILNQWINTVYQKDRRVSTRKLAILIYGQLVGLNKSLALSLTLVSKAYEEHIEIEKLEQAKRQKALKKAKEEEVKRKLERKLFLTKQKKEEKEKREKIRKELQKKIKEREKWTVIGKKKIDNSSAQSKKEHLQKIKRQKEEYKKLIKGKIKKAEKENQEQRKQNQKIKEEKKKVQNKLAENKKQKIAANKLAKEELLKKKNADKKALEMKSAAKKLKRKNSKKAIAKEELVKSNKWKKVQKKLQQIATQKEEYQKKRAARKKKRDKSDEQQDSIDHHTDSHILNDSQNSSNDDLLPTKQNNIKDQKKDDLILTSENGSSDQDIHTDNQDSQDNLLPTKQNNVKDQKEDDLILTSENGGSDQDIHTDNQDSQDNLLPTQKESNDDAVTTSQSPISDKNHDKSTPTSSNNGDENSDIVSTDESYQNDLQDHSVFLEGPDNLPPTDREESRSKKSKNLLVFLQDHGKGVTIFTLIALAGWLATHYLTKKSALVASTKKAEKASTTLPKEE